MNSPYCSTSGRLKPNAIRIWAIVAGSGLRPAISRAGSTPGVLKKIKNVSAEIAKRTTAVHKARRTMNLSIALATHPQLRPRIERFADTIAQYVQRQHREHDHDARSDRDPRSRV